MQSGAVLFERCRSSELDSKTLLGIVYADIKTCSAVKEIAFEEGVEDILRIVAGIAYLSVVGTVQRIRHYVEAYSVETHVCRRKFVKFHCTVHSRKGGRVHIHINALEGVAGVFQETAEHVLLARRKSYVGFGQRLSQSDIVDTPLA